MILMEIRNNPYDYGTPEYKEFDMEYEKVIARSFDYYTENGHEWCWGLVGNIKLEREYGEDHEIKAGTKHFSGGSKVYIAPAQWGDGFDNVVVIGVPRYGKRYIEIITCSKYIENYRLKKVYKPEIIKLMCSSKRRWWNDTDLDRKEIISYLKTLNPEEASKETEKLENEDTVQKTADL